MIGFGYKNDIKIFSGIIVENTENSGSYYSNRETIL